MKFLSIDTKYYNHNPLLQQVSKDLGDMPIRHFYRMNSIGLKPMGLMKHESDSMRMQSHKSTVDFHSKHKNLDNVYEARAWLSHDMYFVMFNKSRTWHTYKTHVVHAIDNLKFASWFVPTYVHVCYLDMHWGSSDVRDRATVRYSSYQFCRHNRHNNYLKLLLLACYQYNILIRTESTAWHHPYLPEYVQHHNDCTQ